MSATRTSGLTASSPGCRWPNDAPGPWGDTLTEYPTGTKLFLVARSPLAALNSVAIEHQQTRSIGFRSQLIWDRRGVDLFGWAVMSMAYWYDICLEEIEQHETPGVVFRIGQSADDDRLGDYLGRRIVRDGKQIWRNQYGSPKKSGRLEYSRDELYRVPKVHLAKLVEVTARLGYPEDAETLRRHL